MIKMKRKTVRFKIFSLFLMICFCTSILSAPVLALGEDVNYQIKISAELWKVMEQAADDELITVSIWMQQIDYEEISEELREDGYDPEIYEDEELFYEVIEEEVAESIIARVGYEAAYYKEEPSTEDGSELQSNDEQEVDAGQYEDSYMDKSISLVDRALSAKIDEYIMLKRELVREECSELNEAFLSENIGKKEREIIYSGEYIRNVIIEAKKDEVIHYAKQNQVEEITLYEELILETELNIAPEQVGADVVTGTKSSFYNEGLGYKGTGVKIGILEAGGCFDSSNPHLSRIASTGQLTFLDNGVAYSVSDHATFVTSIIVGQSVTVDTGVYEGIVPNATAYQMRVVNAEDMKRGFETLVSKGVSVINFSAGIDTGIVYHDMDKAIDELIFNTGVTFIKSAGNKGTTTGNVTSPGKAVNGITVGSVNTKSDGIMPISEYVYNVRYSSSFKHANEFPNKPDITAPGGNISYVRSSGTVYTDSGTSLSTPIVASIVAQMMQGNQTLKTDPNAVKSRLLHGAEWYKISTVDNPCDGRYGSYIRKKSGAGLVNAKRALAENIKTFSGTFESYAYNMPPERVTSFTGVAGERIRLVLVFDTSSSETWRFPDLDVYIEDASGNVIASSRTSYSNVEIIDFFPGSRTCNIYVEGYAYSTTNWSLSYGAIEID